MKSTIIIFVLAFIAGTSQAWKPAETCYSKSTKCCYRFEKCDEKTNVKPINYNCDFKKCAPVCRNACRKVGIVHPKLVCKYKSVPVKICKKKGHEWYFYRKTHCYTKHIKKNYCSKVYKKSYKPKCNKVCSEGCKTIRAVCTKTKTYKFDVYCSKLSCGRTRVSGSTAKPERVTSPNGVVVSTSPSTRKIIGGHDDGDDDGPSGHAGHGHGKGHHGGKILTLI